MLSSSIMMLRLTVICKSHDDPQDESLARIRGEVKTEDVEPVSKDVQKIKAAIQKHQPAWLQG